MEDAFDTRLPSTSAGFGRCRLVKAGYRIARMGQVTLGRSSPSPPFRLRHFAGSLASALVTLTFLGFTHADADLWGHVRFGRDILDGGLHRSDPYSFTSDLPWINHEWLSEAVMAAAYELGGGAGLILLKLAIACCAGALILRAWEPGAGRRLHRDAMIFLVALGAWPLFLTFRPQTFSALLFTALLFALRRVDERSWPYLLAVPAIFAVWANLHGGWVVGAGVLAIYAVSKAFDGSIPLRWRAAIATTGAAAVSATLLNPYGAGLLAFLRATLSPERSDIVEWSPVSSLPPVALLLWSIPTAILLAALWTRKVPRHWALVSIVLGVGSFRVARLVGFHALAAGALLAPFVLEMLRGGRESAPAPRPHVAARVAASLVLVVLATVASGASVRIVGDWAPEPEAARFVKDRRLQGRMLTWFDYGEYAIWHFAPGIKVSFDGRRETVYSGALRAQHAEVFGNGAGASSVVRCLAPDYIWLPAHLPVIPRLGLEGWEPIFVGPRSTILSRTPAAAAVLSVSASGNSLVRYFPGP